MTNARQMPEGDGNVTSLCLSEAERAVRTSVMMIVCTLFSFEATCYFLISAGSQELPRNNLRSFVKYLKSWRDKSIQLNLRKISSARCSVSDIDIESINRKELINICIIRRHYSCQFRTYELSEGKF